jgi:2-polyprenyl-3-methyl-5-hydroxy-6-metoxy-1,4-benzoquinol methylase
MTLFVWLAVVVVVALAIFFAVRTVVRPWIYDVAIVRMTTTWYREVLSRVPRGARVLDVGIGTGAALIANADLMLEKGLVVTGVDYDADYVHSCAAAVHQAKLDAAVAVHNVSVYDFRGGPYDAVYFSGSLMLMPDATAALRHCASLLAPGGKIYSTQTFEETRNVPLELLKPWLKWLTTIDFGRVTYEHEVLGAFKAANLRLICNAAFGDSKSKQRSYHIIVAEPAEV